jgi:hypothetical protein
VAPGSIKDKLVEKGPLSVCLGVGSEYGGGFDAQGVYRCTNDSGTNHCVVIAGYDDADGYWIAKNSWGSSWNGDGYFKVGYGECSIENYVYYASLQAAVGGIAELPPLTGASAEEGGVPSGGSGWSGSGYAALAGGLAAAAIVIAAGGWYARRRWLR